MLQTYNQYIKFIEDLITFLVKKEKSTSHIGHLVTELSGCHTGNTKLSLDKERFSIKFRFTE